MIYGYAPKFGIQLKGGMILPVKVASHLGHRHISLQELDVEGVVR